MTIIAGPNSYYLKSILVILLCAFSNAAGAQGGTWTWMHGADTANGKGNYGTKGVASISNEPPARYEASCWTDKQGNFWMFGGVFVGGMPIGDLGNDLWKFDPGTNMWTWVNGPNVVAAPNRNGVYGTRGVPSVNNYPSAKGYGSATWTDNNGDLWIYGGFGALSYNNELWRYHIATNEWTWMGGFSTGSAGVNIPGSYGPRGVASATNTPGALMEVKSTWVDAANNLWLFGGQLTTDAINVLWRYSPASNQWAWINGDTVTYSPGNYGTMGVEAATNMPESRFSYTHWTDSRGNFYIFGGHTFTVYITRNDVWRYRPSVDKWTWMSGSNVNHDTGRYPPQKCKFYSNYYPSARFENQTAMSTGTCTKAYWTFGGFDDRDSLLNDLWLFDTDSMKWSWMSGDTGHNQVGIYGTRGIPSATNKPPSKGGVVTWVDRNHNLWIFGGFTTYAPGFQGALKVGNDLWRFTPDSTCVNVRALFAADRPLVPDTSLCLGDTSGMYIGTHTSVQYSPSTGVTPNKDTSRLIFQPSVTTSYTVIVNGSNCIPVDTLSFKMSVYPRDTVRLSKPALLRLCKGDTASMPVDPSWNISVTPNTGVSYKASGGTAIQFFPAVNTQYRVIASSNMPCTLSPDTVRFTITRDTLTLHLPPMKDTTLCKGDTAVYRITQRPDIWMLDPATSFTVSKDTTVFRFFPDKSTTYQLIGIKNAGCQPKDTIHFKISRSQFKAAFTLSPKLVVQNSQPIQLTNASVAAQQYKWFVNTRFFSNQISPTYPSADTGVLCFLLQALDDHNCVDTATDCAEVVSDLGAYLPTAFSPNGDGQNDVLYVRGRGIKTMNLVVFNRWGQKVFESNNILTGWDGSFNGVVQDAEVFSYVLRASLIDGSTVTKKGNVTILK
jgi:gliding motility-associated-like protein